jgi:UTP--glucose-1-phosphate uridylyltransferase
MRKAVIPAAGLGTRFLPATKALPKEMLPVVDKPGIQWVVEEAIAAGLTDVLVVTGRTKKTVEDHFDRAPELEQYLEKAGKLDAVALIRHIAELADVHFVRQAEPLGLGHAVGLARHHVGDQAFAVLLPDDLMAPGSDLLARMLAAHERTGGPVIALKRFPPSEISSYGVVVPAGEVDADGLVAVESLVEKPAPEEAPSDLAVMGRYVLTPAVFDAIDRIVPGKGGELQLTDALQLLAQEGPFHGIVFDEGRYDTGNKLDWLRATVELSLQDPALGPDFRAVLTDIVRRAGLA